MGQHNNYYAKVCFLPFQSQDPSPPLKHSIVSSGDNSRIHCWPMLAAM